MRARSFSTRPCSKPRRRDGGEPSSGPSGHLPPEAEGVASSAAPPLPPGEGWGEGALGDTAHHQHASGRIDAVDCARGLALVGMAIYHLSWDLADFRLAPPMLPFTPQMRLLSHIVASAFLLLVGVSLALAHRNGLNVQGLLASPRDRRRRGGAGDRRQLRLRAQRTHHLRHSPLYRGREPPRRTVRDRASLGQPRNRLRGDRGAVAWPLDVVRSALAPMDRTRRGAAEYARLAPAPALGGGRLSRPWRSRDCRAS